MKKLLILGMMVLFLSSLIAVESEPSDVVGFVKYDLVAGDYNMVAVPMEITFTCVDPANPMASDLANEIGNVELLLYWDTSISGWQFYTGAEATDFAIQPGDALMVKLAAGDDTEFYSTGSRVADVATTFAIDYNMLMLPLNHSDITSASELKTALEVEMGSGSIDLILYWDTAISGWQFYTGAEATDYPISIGDALIVKSTAEGIWNSNRTRSDNSRSINKNFNK